MVYFDNQLIGCLKDQLKQNAQDRQKVFNLAVPKRTEAALVGIFIFQIFNVILHWLYPLSTAVSSLVINLNKNAHNGRSGVPNSGGPVIHPNEAPVSKFQCSGAPPGTEMALGSVMFSAECGGSSNRWQLRRPRLC